MVFAPFAFGSVANAQLPNLVPQSIALNKSSVVAGETLTINWTLANTMGGSSPSTVTGVRMNQSSSSSAGTTIINLPMSALGPFGSTPQNTTITVPAGTAPGTYYIWIIADNVTSGAIAQTSYTDDFQHSLAFTVTGQLPNLVPQSIALNKSSVVAGETLTINWTLANTMGGSSPSTVTGVRMNQSSSSSAGTTIINLPMSALGPFGSTPQNTTITVPAGTAPGTYYIWIIADNVTSGAIAQTSYTDDFQHSLAFTVTGQLPNLVPQSIALNKSSVVAGETLTINWTLANTMGGSSPGTVTGVRMNQSSSSSAGTTIINLPMSALGPFGSTPQNTTITVPAGTAPGTYYIWIIADNVTSGAIAQTSYTDDFQHSLAFTVTGQLPNLVPQSIALNKSSVVAGETLTINWTLANTMGGSSPGTVTGVRMNQSSSSSAGTTIINLPMSALGPFGSTPQNTTITVPAGTAPGTYYIWIIADNVTSGAIAQTSYTDDFQHSLAFTVTALTGGEGEPASLGVLWFPSPNFNSRPVSQVIDSIVIHTVQGSYESGKATLTDDTPPLEQRVSAHYIISPTGEITQLVKLDKRAWHATYYNDRSIGIEMAGFADQSSTWTVANLAALESLVAYLVNKYSIPIVHPSADASTYPQCRYTENGLIAHSQVQPGCNGFATKTDPGQYFPWMAFVQNVQTRVGSVLSDSQKQSRILQMVNSHRGVLPAELVLAVMYQEAGRGAFYVDGSISSPGIYRRGDGPWAQPSNGNDDGVMQVTRASGLHERSGPYSHTQAGYDHAIDDGCTYLFSQYQNFGTFWESILHYNTGAGTLYIYKNGWGDPNYLMNVASNLRYLVPPIFGLANAQLANQLDAAQAILDRHLNNPAILENQSLAYYSVFQDQLDTELHNLGSTPSRRLTVVTHVLTTGQAPVFIPASPLENGALISAYPPDNSGSNAGGGAFTLTYPDQTLVTLTAPASTNGTILREWLGAGQVGADTLSLPIRLDGDYAVTNYFVQSAAAQGRGSIRVSIVPQGAVDVGARWRLASEVEWRNSGSAIIDLAFSDYEIEYSTTPGWTKPPNSNLRVSEANPDVWVDSPAYQSMITPTRIVVLSGNFAFGDVPVGTSVSRSLAIGNSGNTAVEVSSIIVPHAYSASFSGSIPVGGLVWVPVVFSPTFVGGFDGTIIVSSDATGGNGAIGVSGIGVALTQSPPVASFSGSPISGTVPLSVTFTDDSTGAITNRFWDFGDASTVNTPATSLMHTYSVVGTNTVSLTVSGSGGSSNLTRVAYIVVTNMPTYTLTVTANNGTVTKNPDQLSYSAGSIVELTALPLIGYEFSHWSGDETGSVNPLPVPMNGNKTVTANFVVGPPPHLTEIVLSNGVIRFVLNGHIGSNYLVQISSNLVDWLPLSTNSIPLGGSIFIADPSFGTDSRRFYRAIPSTNGSTVPVTLIINGSFEFPGTPANGSIDLHPGDTKLFGWTVGGTGDRIVWGNSGSSAAEGTNDLSFNAGNTPAGMWIAQTFNTEIGKNYEVTFYLASTGGLPGSVTLRVSAKSQTGDILAQITATPPPRDTGYGTVQQLFFTASSAITTIEFLDTSSSTVAIDILLDNIAVRRVDP